jgi:membrane associated rhomboid family serine protease
VFLAAPTCAGARVRSLPLATTLLAAILLGLALWTLPARFELRTARENVEQELADARDADRAHVQGRFELPAIARLHTVRRAALQAELEALEASDPVEGAAYSSGAPLALAFTALCVHGDLVHLVGNVVGLVFAGVFVEMVIGPVWTLLLAVVGGAFALAVDARMGPPGGLLVGASSGVAVLLGAYSFLYRNRSIRFSYIIFENLRPVRGSFRIPTPIIAGLWLVQQAVGLALVARGHVDDIAYVSHLVGFALGLLAVTLLPFQALPADRPAPDPA